MRTRVKICCISSVAEAGTAVAAGADAIGLVSAMPSGPGVIGEALIAEIAAAAPPALGTFLLTSEVEPAAIAAQQRRCGVNTIQLCDALDAGAYPALREALPGIALVQVIHVRHESDVAEAVGIAPRVDGLLLDSGNPSAPVKELGGTGRIHDWTLSRRIVAEAPAPSSSPAGSRPTTWPMRSATCALTGSISAQASAPKALSMPRSSAPSWARWLRRTRGDDSQVRAKARIDGSTVTASAL